MQKFSSVCLVFNLCLLLVTVSPKEEKMQSKHASNWRFLFGLLLNISTRCQNVRRGFKCECRWSVPSVTPGPSSPRQRCCMHISSRCICQPSSRNPQPEERGERPLADTLQAAAVRIKLSWVHKHMFFSPQTILRGLDVAGVNLTAESCIGCCLWWVSRWAVAICARDAISVLAVIEKHRQDSPWESIFVRVLCPPVGLSLLVTHEFSTYAMAASLTNVQPLSLWNLIYSCL